MSNQNNNSEKGSDPTPGKRRFLRARTNKMNIEHEKRTPESIASNLKCILTKLPDEVSIPPSMPSSEMALDEMLDTAAKEFIDS